MSRIEQMAGVVSPGEDWSFWDVASPLRATAVIADLYGAEAASKAMECAAAARDDGREDDRRFWMAVYARLRAVDHRRAEAVR